MHTLLVRRAYLALHNNEAVTLISSAGGELPPAEQLCQEVERVVKDRQADTEDASMASSGQLDIGMH